MDARTNPVHVSLLLQPDFGHSAGNDPTGAETCAPIWITDGITKLYFVSKWQTFFFIHSPSQVSNEFCMMFAPNK